MSLVDEGINILLGKVDEFVPQAKKQKRRAAVVAHDGFALSDFFDAHRSTVCLGAFGAAVVFALLALLRRKHGTEAVALWLSLSALSAGIGYAAMPKEAGDGSQTDGILAMIDKRANSLDSTEPGWDEATLRRVVNP